MKVAVIGAGVSGCRLAQILSLHSPQFTFKVDVFDAGRECGGRSSTRIHANQVGEDFFFDHGAQYISKGKTLDFQKLMEEWLLAGTVKGWKGKVGVWDRDHFQDEHENDRWTPIPTMNSLCKTMLGANSEGITTHYSCRVKAESCGTIGGNGWNLYDMKTGSHLGCWDVLVSTDRKFCPISVDSQLTSEFIEPLRLAVTDVPSLAVMVAYDEATSKTIDSFPYTSVQILDHPILSWISRCSSQPGRERSDGSACWVLHSTSSFATDVIQQVTDAEREGRVSNTRKAVASAAEGPMHQAFLDLLSCHPSLTGSQKEGRVSLVPTFIQGHRWGAAFPYKRQSDLVAAGMGAEGLAAGRGLAYVDKAARFVAVGDYFSPPGRGEGRIEGACLSAQAGAEAIIAWLS